MSNRDDTNWLLGLILIFLMGIIISLGIGLTAISDNQRAQICLEHTTYPPCAAWKAP